jgi:hypothetical protein
MDESDDVDTTPITTNIIRARKMRSTLTFDIGDREIVMKHYFVESDYRRNLIKGSIHAQRRKIMIWKRMQSNVHSFFFLVRKEIPTYPEYHYSSSNSDIVNME